MSDHGTGMFPIEVRCNLDKTRVAGIIEQKADALGLSGNAVASVVVAADNESDYGACIKRSKGFTGGQTHSPGGVGKTLPFFDADQKVRSDLVFKRFIFEELVAGNPASDDHKLYDYIVSHELGHAADFSARRVFHPNPLTDFGGPINTLATYWGPLLLSEFAASLIAGKATSGDQYELIAKNSIDCISSGMAALGTYKCQVYWNVLVEQAKIAGTSLGSPSLAKPEFAKWARIGPGIVDQLRAFVDELKVLKASYPGWDEAIETERLTERCEALFDAMKQP